MELSVAWCGEIPMGHCRVMAGLEVCLSWKGWLEFIRLTLRVSISLSDWYLDEIGLID